MGLPRAIWVGYDTREAAAWAVTMRSLQNNMNWWDIDVHSLVLSDLRARGFYKRPTEIRDGRMFDVISEAPMATEFAITRFLIGQLTKYLVSRRNFSEDGQHGWAIFMDCDMLVRRSIRPLFEFLEKHPNKAMFCVQHQHIPNSDVKMDNQIQTTYARKNWSSLYAINLDHPANDALDLELVNTVPGRDLHRFCWLEDKDIGALPVEYNWLVGHSPQNVDPVVVHFTDGLPFVPGYENVPFADEWRRIFRSWSRADYQLNGM